MCTTRNSTALSFFLSKGANPFLKDKQGYDTLAYALTQRAWRSLAVLMRQEFPTYSQPQLYLNIINTWDMSTQQSFKPYAEICQAVLEQHNIIAQRNKLDTEVAWPFRHQNHSQVKDKKNKILKI